MNQPSNAAYAALEACGFDVANTSFAYQTAESPLLRPPHFDLPDTSLGRLLRTYPDLFAVHRGDVRRSLFAVIHPSGGLPVARVKILETHFPEPLLHLKVHRDGIQATWDYPDWQSRSLQELLQDWIQTGLPK